MRDVPTTRVLARYTLRETCSKCVNLSYRYKKMYSLLCPRGYYGSKRCAECTIKVRNEKKTAKEVTAQMRFATESQRIQQLAGLLSCLQHASCRKFSVYTVYEYTTLVTTDLLLL